MPAITLSTYRAQKIVAAVQKSRLNFLIYSRAKQADLIDLYRQAALELQRQISFYAEGDGSVSLLRLESLLRDTRRTIEVMGNLRDKQLDRGIRDSVRMGIETYRAPLDLAGHGTGELVAHFGLIHRESVEAVYDFIAADGLQLSDRLWRLTAGAKQAVADTLQQAVIQGESSRETAQRLIRKGEVLTSELKIKMGANKSARIGSDVAELFTPKGEGNVVHNALRVTRTELARANNEGFLRTGAKLSTVAGDRWNLSGSHPRRDICDTYATQDIDGLGPGGYAKGNYPSLGHPECMCFPTPIFKFELEGQK